ncbi:hypothetical protein BDR26DRAFT_869324 [Obelidium mucronatum]|nr:hypothetical protein BDR26DRAFT_869324 [Obelidium mucronatum]
MTHPHQHNHAAHQAAVSHAADAVSKPQQQQQAQQAQDQQQQAVNAYEVGWLFVQEYYTFLNKEPQKLYFFYNSKSSFIHGTECESLDTQTGQKEIQNRILELDFHDCKVLVSNVDSQLSHGGCIVIMVLGEMSNKGGASHKFCQCFVLAEQPSGYFVYNDMFRFLKEDIDNEYEDAADPMYENDYLNSINHSNHINEVQSIQPTAVAAAAVPAAAVSSLSPTPASAVPRGRSQSPKKVPTPTPAAAPLRARSPSPKKEPVAAAAAPASAPGPIGKPSPVAPSGSLSAAAGTATPPAKAPLTPAKTGDVDREFIGSWAESVPTPAAAPASAAANGNPSSPTKASQQKKKGTTPAKTEAAAASVASVAAPVTPAAPAKPKTWATLVSTNTDAATTPAASVVKPLAAKPSNEGLKQQQRPVSSQAGKAPASAAAQPLAVKRVPTTQQPPQAAPAASNEDGSQNGANEFLTVQRGRNNGGRGGHGNGQQQRPFQVKGEESYPRSIFFHLSDELNETNIRDFFSKDAGPVVDVIIPKGKNVVFVEFEDAATASGAIGKSVTINGKTFTPLQRRPLNRFPYQQNNNNNNNNNQSRNGVGAGGRPHSSQGSAPKGNAVAASS